MTANADALHYAVRLSVVSKYVGQLSLVLAALTLAPLGVSLLCGEFILSGKYALVTGGLTLFGVLLSRLRSPARIQVNEGMVVATLVFLLAPLMMAYPFMAAGLSFPDALFEAISGVTTTGLSTVTAVESFSKTFLFARAWMQWYGGLGIVVLSLVLVVESGLVAKGLAVTESGQDDLVGGAKAHARRVLWVYGVLTVCGIIGLWVLGIGPFNSVTYALAAVSTGGFAPQNQSIASLSSWLIQGAVLVLCFLGALPFALYYRTARDERRADVHFLQTRALLISGGLITILLGLCLLIMERSSWSEIFRQAPLLAFSAQTTAGFSTMNLAVLDSASKLVLILAMFIGGGVGSTAGGLKILRLILAVRLLQTVILRTGATKHAVIEPQLQGRHVPESELHDALLLIFLFIVVVTASWLPFLMFDYDPLDSLFEVVSATGTVGLSVGITSSSLPVLLKMILCLDMLLGRLEIVAWLVFLSPGAWIGRRMEES